MKPTTPIISGGMNALRAPARLLREPRSRQRHHTSGGGAYGHIDSPAAGAMLAERRPYKCWKSGADPIECAKGPRVRPRMQVGPDDAAWSSPARSWKAGRAQVSTAPRDASDTASGRWGRLSFETTPLKTGVGGMFPLAPLFDGTNPSSKKTEPSELLELSGINPRHAYCARPLGVAPGKILSASAGPLGTHLSEHFRVFNRISAGLPALVRLAQRDRAGSGLSMWP